MKIVSKYKLEIVKESSSEYNIETKRLSCPFDAVNAVTEVFQLNKQAEEVFCMFALDTKNNIVGAFEVSRGTLNSSLVHPREVFKRALLTNASSVLLAHNHPSGNTEPSREDITLTNRLIECGKILGIKVLEHIIIGDNYYSFKEEGLL